MFQYLIFFNLESKKLTLLVVPHGRNSVSKPGSFLSMIFPSLLFVHAVVHADLGYKILSS